MSFGTQVLEAESIGWEVSHKATTLKKRRMSPEEIPCGYFKIHPDDLEAALKAHQTLKGVT